MVEANNRRHDPPFDGKACPMCPMAFRNLSAVVHNFLHDGNEFDLVQMAVAGCAPLVTADTAKEIRDLHEAAAEYSKWRERATQAPNEESREFAAARMRDWLKPLRAASDAVGPLTDAHFADRLHSHGEIR